MHRKAKAFGPASAPYVGFIGMEITLARTLGWVFCIRAGCLTLQCPLSLKLLH